MSRLSLCLLLLLSSYCLLVGCAGAAEAGSANPSAAANFIRASCRATRYPALCVHSLSSYASSIRQSEKQLAQAALSVSLARARSTAALVSKMKTRASGMKRREHQALRDCIDNMGDTIYQLGRSIQELGHTGRSGGRQDFMWHMNNVQTWVSAALTDEDTCVDGFAGHAMDGNVKAIIKSRVIKVAQVTSNALALVNRFAARP